MRTRTLGALAALFAVCLSGSTQGQSQTEDPIQALKDSLTSGQQQGSVLQGVLGNADGTNKKTDKKLNTPETVQQKTNQQTTDLFEKANKEIKNPSMGECFARTKRILNCGPTTRY